MNKAIRFLLLLLFSPIIIPTLVFGGVVYLIQSALMGEWQ